MIFIDCVVFIDMKSEQEKRLMLKFVMVSKLYHDVAVTKYQQSIHIMFAEDDNLQIIESISALIE